MTDCFALFGQPRRPWLDAGLIKEIFLERSTRTHPDKIQDPVEKAAAQWRFAELNAAHETLRDPQRRLTHLLTLERGAKPSEVHAISPGTADLFLAVGQLTGGVESFLAKRAAANTALQKAQLYPRALDWVDKLNAFCKSLGKEREGLLDALRKLDSSWNSPATPPPAAALDELEVICHQLRYLDRWEALLRQHSLTLQLG
ncbi:MAG: J domain-containing protein [Pedosphaera sp.]|nr:J domain-containing protein [Pedosphaera sp.]